MNLPTSISSKLADKPVRSIRDTLLIRNTEIPVLHRELNQADLRFYPENPRVHSALRANDKRPSQDEIGELLEATEHVKQLAQDIKRDGGLTEPIIVRLTTLEVLEGNSRLAAYRLLARSDPMRWAKIRCMILPEDISDSLVFALLGQYHIKGRLGWVPFEQAGFLYRRFKLHHGNMQALADEIGLKLAKAEHLVSTYKFMITHKDESVKHWSFYDEYLKSREISKARERHDELDAAFVKWVKAGGDALAVDVRTKFARVCRHERILRKFISGAWDLDESYKALVETGAEAHAFQKLQRINTWLHAEETLKEIESSTGAERQRIILEVKKLPSRIARINKALGKHGVDGVESTKRSKKG